MIYASKLLRNVEVCIQCAKTQKLRKIFNIFVCLVAQETIMRDCLSALSFRTDIPADKYEGCRPAAKDIRLAHYVNHTIKEHDVKRDYFNDVTFCFCFLDHRCNSGTATAINTMTLLVSLSIVLFLARKLI